MTELKSLDNLDPAIRSWLVSGDINKRLGFIASNKQLSDEQSKILALLVRLFCSGDILPKDFTSSLKEKLDVTHEEARAIARSIIDHVLLPIRTPLLKQNLNILDIPAH